MTLKKLLIAVAAVAGASAFAQTSPQTSSLGTVTETQGVVTATHGGSGMTVSTGMAVQNGMRFVTTSNGLVTMRLNSGCTITVPSAHVVTVAQDMTCQQLAAAVRSVGPMASLPTPTVASSAVVNGFVGAGAAVIAVGGTRVIDNDPPLSGR